MKKLIVLLLAAVGLSGCGSSSPQKYDVTCLTFFGPIALSDTELEGLTDWGGTYTLTLPNKSKLIVAKSACVVTQAPPASEDKKAE